MPGAVMQNTPLPERRTVTPPFALDMTGESEELSTKPKARAVPGAPVAPGAPAGPAGPPGPAGSWPALKAFFRSVPDLILADVIVLFLSLEPAIVDGTISEGHGRALAAITIPELQRAVLQIVVDRHLSVRQTEELVRRKREPTRIRERKPLSDDLADLEAQLRGVLATRVGIVRTRRGGRLVIDFFSDEELDRIYTIITRGAGSGVRAAVPVEAGAEADSRDAHASVHPDEA